MVGFLSGAGHQGNEAGPAVGGYGGGAGRGTGRGREKRLRGRHTLRNPEFIRVIVEVFGLAGHECPEAKEKGDREQENQGPESRRSGQPQGFQDGIGVVPEFGVCQEPGQEDQYQEGKRRAGQQDEEIPPIARQEEHGRGREEVGRQAKGGPAQRPREQPAG